MLANVATYVMVGLVSYGQNHCKPDSKTSSSIVKKREREENNERDMSEERKFTASSLKTHEEKGVQATDTLNNFLLLGRVVLKTIRTTR